MARRRCPRPGTAVICLRHADFSAERGSSSESDSEARGESTRLGGDFARLDLVEEDLDFWDGGFGEEGGLLDDVHGDL